MGKPFLPWQRYTADVALEIDDDGRFAYQLVVVTVPRQSGKTTLEGVVMDQRAIVIPNGRVWFTMQTQKDAVDWLINEHWPLLAGFGDGVSLRRAMGSENITWHTSNGLVRPFPPSVAGLHGKTSDLVVIDEGWSFDLVKGQQLDQGIVPTQATRPNAQVWKLSTAGEASSLWWLGVVESGRAAVLAERNTGVAFFDWSCPDDMDPTDPASWPLYHPAYGRTIGAPAMEAALAMLGPDDFARAYGNRWVSMVARVIPLKAWRAAQDERAPMPVRENMAIGFDVALDRSDAAIAAVARRQRRSLNRNRRLPTGRRMATGPRGRTGQPLGAAWRRRLRRGGTGHRRGRRVDPRRRVGRRVEGTRLRRGLSRLVGGDNGRTDWTTCPASFGVGRRGGRGRPAESGRRLVVGPSTVRNVHRRVDRVDRCVVGLRSRAGPARTVPGLLARTRRRPRCRDGRRLGSCGRRPRIVDAVGRLVHQAPARDRRRFDDDTPPPLTTRGYLLVAVVTTPRVTTTAARMACRDLVQTATSPAQDSICGHAAAVGRRSLETGMARAA